MMGEEECEALANASEAGRRRLEEFRAWANSIDWPIRTSIIVWNDHVVIVRAEVENRFFSIIVATGHCECHVSDGPNVAMAENVAIGRALMTLKRRDDGEGPGS